MERRTITRATAPHLPTLGATLAPLLATANAGSFHLQYLNGAVVLEQGSFTGVDWPAVLAAVAAAPASTAALDTRVAIDAWPREMRAFVRLVVVELNRVRQNPTTVYPAFTEAQVITAIKTEADSL